LVDACCIDDSSQLCNCRASLDERKKTPGSEKCQDEMASAL
jgi:hypothetical protein